MQGNSFYKKYQAATTFQSQAFHPPYPFFLAELPRADLVIKKQCEITYA
jgi:hypothetical protein